MSIHPCKTVVRFPGIRLFGGALAHSGKRIPEAASFYNGTPVMHAASSEGSTIRKRNDNLRTQPACRSRVYPIRNSRWTSLEGESTAERFQSGSPNLPLVRCALTRPFPVNTGNRPCRELVILRQQQQTVQFEPIIQNW